jgi:hypothetical protein
MARGFLFYAIFVQWLSTHNRAAANIGKDDAVTTLAVETGNNDAARRNVNNTGAAQAHSACLFFGQPRGAAIAATIRTTPITAVTWTILDVEPVTNILRRGSRCRRREATDGE